MDKKRQKKTRIKELDFIPVEKLREFFNKNKIDNKLEQVIRMRHGIAESEDHKLSFRGQNIKETRVKLALIEQELLKELNLNKSSKKKVASKTPTRDKIIETLKRLK